MTLKDIKEEIHKLRFEQVIKLLRNFIERGSAAPKKGNSYTIKV
jgi:hypothetical protein